MTLSITFRRPLEENSTFKVCGGQQQQQLPRIPREKYTTQTTRTNPSTFRHGLDFVVEVADVVVALIITDEVTSIGDTGDVDVVDAVANEAGQKAKRELFKISVQNNVMPSKIFISTHDC